MAPKSETILMWLLSGFFIGAVGLAIAMTQLNAKEVCLQNLSVEKYNNWHCCDFWENQTCDSCPSRCTINEPVLWYAPIVVCVILVFIIALFVD